MEFEIKYEQTKKYLSKSLRSQFVWTAISLIPVLYILYVVTSIMNYYFGDQTVPTIYYRIWYDAVVLTLISIYFAFAHQSTLRKHFRHRNPYPVILRFNSDGLYSETDLDTSTTKWIAIIKTKRTSDSFVIQVVGGNIYIPLALLTNEQTLYIESMVSKNKVTMIS
jgi:hypothetical protein